MPITKLEFQLPEEQNEFILASRGTTYWCCLREVEQLFRDYRKYKDLTESQFELIEKLSDKFYDIVGNVLEEVE